MHIHELLRSAIERRASDLHLKAGSYPMIRVDGTLVVASEEKRLEREDTELLARTIMSPAQFERFRHRQQVARPAAGAQPADQHLLDQPGAAQP